MVTRNTEKGCHEGELELSFSDIEYEVRAIGLAPGVAVSVVHGSAEDAEYPEAGHDLSCHQEGVGLQAGGGWQLEGGQGEHQVLKQYQQQK